MAEFGLPIPSDVECDRTRLLAVSSMRDTRNGVVIPLVNTATKGSYWDVKLTPRDWVGLSQKHTQPQMEGQIYDQMAQTSGS